MIIAHTLINRGQKLFILLIITLINPKKKLFILLIIVGCAIFHRILIVEYSQLNFYQFSKLKALLISTITI